MEVGWRRRIMGTVASPSVLVGRASPWRGLELGVTWITNPGMINVLIIVATQLSWRNDRSRWTNHAHFTRNIRAKNARPLQ